MSARWLRGCDRAPAEVFDAALLDLDGVVYVGPKAVDGAPERLAEARRRGMRLAFVTNNASRAPGQVAEQLRRLGVPAEDSEVVTSAQAAAGLLAERLRPGAPVLVVGGAGLVAALEERGLRPVRSADDAPEAVAQGYAPEVGWALLAEGAYAVARGIPWVATNLDRTIPTPRGTAPGNGSLVEVIRLTTGREPDAVAGKPALPLHQEAVRRTGAARPLVVGDRLDTDIAGAVAAGTASLLVLTGVTTPTDLLRAPASARPTFVAESLAGLLEPHPEPLPGGDGWTCGGWTATAAADGIVLTGAGTRLDGLRVVCASAWAAGDEPSLGSGERRGGMEAALARLGW